MLSSKISSDKLSSGSGKSALKTLTELYGAKKEPLGVDPTGSCRGSDIPDLRADLRTVAWSMSGLALLGSLGGIDYRPLLA
jgi:hypothetical protein